MRVVQPIAVFRQRADWPPRQEDVHVDTQPQPLLRPQLACQQPDLQPQWPQQPHGRTPPPPPPPRRRDASPLALGPDPSLDVGLFATQPQWQQQPVEGFGQALGSWPPQLGVQQLFVQQQEQMQYQVGQGHGQPQFASWQESAAQLQLGREQAPQHVGYQHQHAPTSLLSMLEVPRVHLRGLLCLRTELGEPVPKSRVGVV